MKSKVVLFVTGYILLVLSSCLNSDEIEYEISRDPQIASFSLSHDSISGLSDVKFVIDQVEGLIYNGDSLPFGTDIDQKLWATITFSTAVTEVEIRQQATDETILWTGNTEKDSINFTKPLEIKTTAMDGFTTKRYLAKLNVHQVLPDTMEWRNIVTNGVFPGETIQEQKVVVYPEGGNTLWMYAKTNSGWELRTANIETPANWTEQTSVFSYDDINISQMTVIGDYIFAPGIDGSLYFSTDGKEWQEDNSKTVKSIVGVLSDGETSQLVLVTERNGDNYFSELILDAENLTYTITDSDKQVSANFPLEDFSSVNYEKIDYSPLMVVFQVKGMPGLPVMVLIGSNMPV